MMRILAGILKQKLGEGCKLSEGDVADKLEQALTRSASNQPYKVHRAALTTAGRHLTLQRASIL